MERSVNEAENAEHGGEEFGEEPRQPEAPA
jgi:hypothetical protein